MSISQTLLPEIDHEMAKTRKTLERLPEDKVDFVPHDKSMPLGKLALHIAEMVGWGADTMLCTEYNMNPPDGPAYQPPAFEGREALLATFEANLARFRAEVEKAPDAAWGEMWSLKSGDMTYFTMPRAAVIRDMILNHIIHHRAQLGVYYRLVGVPVPALYGPSADEQ
ncbi:MAG TPA: DinB family protein [Thermoanaerobaculia bacterium]|nr:DinB family protein [Thermoanaerobaculia bacterium]